MSFNKILREIVVISKKKKKKTRYMQLISSPTMV